MKALELANYILGKYSNKEITPLKLQKLVYYVKSWSLVSNIDLGEIKFYKWNFGPVNKEVYNAFKSFGKTVIQQNDSSISNYSTEIQEFINFIVENYIQFDAFTLSAMTHQEEPWIKTKDDEIISESLIAGYYSKKEFAKNFPYSKNNKFYPLKNNLDFSFELDFSPTDKNNNQVYNSFEEYLEMISVTKHHLKETIENLLNEK